MSTLMYKSGTSWIDVIHPVGSMWLSNSSTSPSSLFGGTWQQFTNAVLRAAAAYGYGGSDSHTLTIDEIPMHTHSLHLAWGNGGSGSGLQFGTWFTSTSTSTSYINANGGGRLFLFYLDTAISTVGSELANSLKGVL